MGILDGLGGSGLLDFLRNNAMNQSMSAGLPSDQANYGAAPFSLAPAQQATLMQRGAPHAQPSPLDTAQWPAGPIGAPSSAMAAMPQAAAPFSMGGATPPARAAETPGIGDRIMATMRSVGHPGGILEGVANGLTAFSTGQPVNAATAATTATSRALEAKGVAPEAIAAARGNPDLMKLLITQAYGPQSVTSIGNGYVADKNGKVTRAYEPDDKDTGDIREYQFAKKEDPSLTFDKFMQRKKSVSGEFGMQPIWGTGPDGKPAVLQLGKSGEAKQSVLPQGFNLARDPLRAEGPTGTAIIDPQTRQQVGFIPKDVAGGAKAKEIGEAEGQAVVNLPTTISTAESALKSIQQLREHPGKKSWGAFGVGAMIPDMPGSETRGFAAMLDQIKGMNFMTAFQSLKGAGAITDAEGKKAEAAQARLDRAQSEKDFDVALSDLEASLAAGMTRARQKAGITTAPAAAASKPATVSQNGHTYTLQADGSYK